MTETIVASLLVVVGAAGLFLAMPRGGARAGRGPLVLLGAAGAVLVTLLASAAGRGGTAGWFVGLSVVAVAAAIRMITHRRPVYSALYFVLVVVAVAGLVLLLGAEFLAAALVIIYAGAILVTYVFVIMLAQQTGAAACDREAREPLLATAAGFVLLGVLGSRLFAPAVEASSGAPPAPPGDVTWVGTQLLTRYVVGVEIAGVLLLASMVGAIVIARRRVESGLEEDAA